MKKRTIPLILLSAILFITYIPAQSVSAATGVSISVSGNTEVGGVITVSAVINSSDYSQFSGFNGTLVYDSAFLTLKQNPKAGNYTCNSYVFEPSKLTITAYEATISPGATLFTASFTCIQAGSTNIGFTLEGLGADQTEVPDASSGSKAVTITTPVPKSSNSNLSSLLISPGTLSPAFSKSVTSYTASVPATQSKITVSATPEDGKSSVTLNGVQNKLSSGANTVKITVKAEDGSTKVYSIVVTRESGPTSTPTPTPQPLPLMTYGSSDYTILQPSAGDSIPDGFTATTVTYKGVAIPAVTKSLGTSVDPVVTYLVLLSGDAGNAFYVYRPETESCYPYTVLTLPISSYQALNAESTGGIPSGYELFSYTLNGVPVDAYRLISQPDNPQILLFLMDVNGISGFYSYDSQTGLLMPYRGAVTLVTPTPTPSPSPSAAISDSEKPTVTDQPIPGDNPKGNHLTTASLTDFTDPIVSAAYLFFILFVLFLVLTIVYRVKYRKIVEERDEYEEEEERQVTDLNRATEEPIRRTESSYTSFVDPDLYHEEPLSKSEIIPDVPDLHPDKSRSNPAATSPFVAKMETIRPQFDFPDVTRHGDSNDVLASESAKQIVPQSNMTVVEHDKLNRDENQQRIPVRLQMELDEERKRNRVSDQENSIDSRDTMKKEESSPRPKPIDPDQDPDDGD